MFQQRQGVCCVASIDRSVDGRTTPSLPDRIEQWGKQEGHLGFDSIFPGWQQTARNSSQSSELRAQQPKRSRRGESRHNDAVHTCVIEDPGANYTHPIYTSNRSTGSTPPRPSKNANPPPKNRAGGAMWSRLVLLCAAALAVGSQAFIPAPLAPRYVTGMVQLTNTCVSVDQSRGAIELRRQADRPTDRLIDSFFSHTTNAGRRPPRPSPAPRGVSVLVCGCGTKATDGRLACLPRRHGHHLMGYINY